MSDVAIRPYEPCDLVLLERLLGDPEMMRHIGGPETAEAIVARHERYLASDPERGGLFTVVIGRERTAVGWVGYWESSWDDEPVWECGWHVLADHQGRGVATAATALMLQRARAAGKHRYIHAFPSFDNAASNAVCRHLGFACKGEVDVEYPRGCMMHSNDWCLDLSSEGSDEAASRTTGEGDGV